MSGHYYESNKNSVGFHRNNNEFRYSEDNPYKNNYNGHSQNNQGTARRNNNGLPPRYSYNERNRGYNNEQSSSHHNYSGDHNHFNNDQSLSRRSNNFTIHRRNEQDFSRGGRRPGPYDTVSRSRQSSTTRNVRVGPSTREEQETSRTSLSQVSDARIKSDDILAGWDESPSENCDWSTGTHQQISSWNAAAQDPSLLKSNPPKEKAYGVVERKEEKKISTTSSTSSEKKKATDQADDDDIVWVTQNETTPLNSVAIRPHSPFPFELLDEDNNKMVTRNNKGKSRASRDRYQEEDFPKNANDDTNNYKGISFPPPFPIIPVSSDTNEKPTILPDIDRIFENDSRSAAQTFENLSKIAKTLWNDFTDVPLDLASEQYVNPEEYLKDNSEKLKECSEDFSKKNDIKSPLLIEGPKERDLSDTERCNPKSTTSQYISIETSRTSRTSRMRTLRPPFSNDRYVAKEIQNSDESFTIRETSTVEETSTTLMHSSQKKDRFEEEVCDMVDKICRADPTRWLNVLLGNAHKLIPNIKLFDTDRLQKLLKILSSPIVLNANNKDSRDLIKMFIDQQSFYEKIFSYMKNDVNFGSDFLHIIRLTDFVVKHFPDAVQKIPHKDINGVYEKLESTCSKAESEEVSEFLKNIERYRPRNITDQKKGKKEKKPPPKPNWIIQHIENYIEKPLEPLPDEIFNLEEMMTKPKLTPHLANRSWMPEHEEIYRQVHYDLLRTEIVEDLQRASVSFFAINCEDYNIPEDSPFYNYVFYRDVRIVDTHIDKNFTPYVKVGFKPSRPVDWIKGEHLIYGTFVLLFKVKFESNNVSADISSMTWAMVEHFNLNEIIRPNGNKDSCWQSQDSYVGLNFSESELKKLDINGNYVMLESTRNYASIRPVMEWLKESSIQRVFPLYRELFSCDLGIKHTPGYLENVSFDITSILVDQGQPTITKDLSKWPNYLNLYGNPAYNMERSCVFALRHIISNKVAVISAPIITSKAKVASTAVEFLYRALEQSHCHEPILILTRSSYALDNILEQLLPSFPDLIRCGSLSKCKSSTLHARQIQHVVNDFSKKTNFRRGWPNISKDMINKREELAELFRLKKYALSISYFVETSPEAFRDQLVPTSFKYWNFGFESEKAMLERCLELWLSGKSVTENTLYPSTTRNQMRSTKDDFPAFYSSSSRNNLQRTVTTLPAWSSVVQGFNRPHQGIVLDNKPLKLKLTFNLLFTKEMINKGTRSHDAQILSFFDELSESYLFENDWTKSNGCNDDEISLPSNFDKEILDNQIDDRVIFKSEECKVRANLNFNNKHNTENAEFSDVAKNFWKTSGKNIWEINLDGRRSLYDRFCQRHIEFFDPKIRELQMNAISEAEKPKSALLAKWIEVCSFAPVIGMTVSYATAYRELLTTIKPRICIMDEASEILESQMMFLISSDRLEHLIMFGDIQYSKPDVKSRTTQDYGLDVSLFERWIKCDGKFMCLNQQCRMNPDVFELVRTFYDKKETENVAANNINNIKGVTSNVFFMTHDKFDDENWTSFKKINTFEAHFVVRFAFYLYQQGYDPAKITILTPYLGQKILILKLLNPELKQELTNIYNGRFDKERNQTGKIKVELIDNYSSEENDIVLLSLVSVRKNNWRKEALKSLNNKKRAIIALSRALHALYIFGNEEMLRKSEIWAPVVKKLAEKKNTYGESLILSCKNHVNQRIEITTPKDFETKVPFGGCSKPCDTSLTCGHKCPRKCHPIIHTEEVNYLCKERCGGRFRPEGCDHDCPNKCYECEKLKKCPPCDESIKIRLRCKHITIIPCRMKSNIDKMTLECKEKINFRLRCGHSSVLPCSTRLPICQETCGKSFPCGHRCQRRCGTEHSHERSDCLSECVKTLICGHQCANGCNEPNRHTAFCSERCRIKCLHGHMCPKTCHETCTRCLEPCPWRCKHHKCNKKCSEYCDRSPCDKRCTKILECTHQCNGFCGEKCPPCLRCNPNLRCSITLSTFSEMEVNERIYVLPECNCVFIAEGLDSYFRNQVKDGDHTAIRLWQCPGCKEPIFTAMRYNYYLKVEINLWNIIKRKQEAARNMLSLEERKQIINAMNEETRINDFNSMVGGRWFVCPNNHPYYIGNCGGATQLSKCPDCSATIGGTQHRVISNNRFYGEFDNSASPAWPGQH